MFRSASIYGYNTAVISAEGGVCMKQKIERWGVLLVCLLLLLSGCKADLTQESSNLSTVIGTTEQMPISNVSESTLPEANPQPQWEIPQYVGAPYTEIHMETFKAISSFAGPQPEKIDEHYFEVCMIGVPQDSGLLEENDVWSYLAETAPVDFNSQQFSQAQKIRDYFEDRGCPITCYKILRGSRKLPIYKPYSRSLSTGKQAKTKNKDYVRDVEFVYAEASDGQPLYIGWLALTDFSGIISDESVQGIRFRKGNILVGNNTTFAKYFPSEGHNANRMFAGEIHALHTDLIPNSQRDDFEPNAIYGELRQALSKWAGEINKKYRRGMSEATSALRRLNKLNAAQKDLEEKIDSGAITSDEKREQIAEQLKQIAKKREAEEKTVRKAQERGTFDAERKETIEKVLAQTETASKKMASLNKKVVNADYATKHDLPSSYSRDERKLYQRIITVIDTFFTDDPQTAEKLREAIQCHFCLSEGSVTAFIDTTFNQIFCIETKTIFRKHLIIALRKAGEAFFQKPDDGFQNCRAALLTKVRFRKK